MKRNYLKIFINDKLQNQIMVSYLVVISFICAVLCGASYGIASYNSEQNAIKSYSEMLDYVGSGIVENLTQAEQLSDYLYANKKINEVLTMENDSEIASYYAISEVNQNLEEFALYSHFFTNISAIKIIGANGYQVIFGEDAIHLNKMTINTLPNYEWYDDTTENSGRIYWIGSSTNYAKSSESTVSLARQILGQKDIYEVLGYMYLSMNSSYFDQIFQDASVDSNVQLYILDANNNVVYDNLSHDSANYYDYLTDVQLDSETSVVEYIDGEKTLVVVSSIQQYEWSIVAHIPYSEITQNNRLYILINVAIGLVAVGVALMLFYFISLNLFKPIEELTAVMRCAQEGDLSVRSDYEKENEVGRMSRTFNYMLSQIQILMNRVVHEENAKKDMEYQALQSMINPHFLYNTLSAIRFMAMIQGTQGISEAIGNLIRLMQSTTQQTGLITLEQELEIANNYIAIMKIRHADKFNVIFDIEPDTYNLLCLKFMLQPIIENAIFHGIENKEGYGVITINTRREDDILYIEIEDNGVGMTQEDIERIFSATAVKSNGLNSIGIVNVDSRIKLIYGERYGIQIESELHKYTKVRVSIKAVETERQQKND